MKIVDNELAREVISDIKNALEIEIKAELRKKIEERKTYLEDICTENKEEETETNAIVLTRIQLYDEILNLIK